MRLRSVLVVALLLLAPTLAFAPTASACGSGAIEVGNVPCGRIYPFILIKVPDQQPRYDMEAGKEYEFQAELTYKFNINDNGYTVAMPNEPVVITFEYPRKPDWVDLVVEPERIEVPVNDASRIQPNADDPNNVQAEYVYTTPITIKARLNGAQPVLRDGFEFAKLLVFAKSTESGLYQSGYGIKEIRVLPEGHVFESDVAGSRDVFTATPLEPTFGGSAQAWNLDGAGVLFEMPDELRFWEPTPVDVVLAASKERIPQEAGRMFFSVREESGATIAQHGPVDVSEQQTFPVTFVHPGLHFFTLTVMPGANSALAPATWQAALTIGEPEAEGYAFPKTYQVAQRVDVPRPIVNAEDPLVQFEHEIPFFAFDTAQSTVASVTLVTPGADALARSATNLEFVIVDPEGKSLQAQTVDPSNPARNIRIGSLPGDGWYALRVRGVGAEGGAYDVRIEATYALAPEARNLADGMAQPTPAMLSLGGRNVTLPVDEARVWIASDLTPVIEGYSNARYWLTVHENVEHRVVYASGMRAQDQPASFTAPGPGLYHATVYVEPDGGPAFAPMQRTFTFRVGAGMETTAATYALEDAVPLPSSPTPVLLAAYRIPAPDAATLDGSATAGPLARLQFALVDRDGEEVASGGDIAAFGKLDPVLGPYTLLVYGASLGAPDVLDLEVQARFATPVTLADMDTPPMEPAGDVKIPGLALGLGLAVTGLLAVAVALVRRT